MLTISLAISESFGVGKFQGLYFFTFILDLYIFDLISDRINK
jgi:hypothetical protein